MDIYLKEIPTSELMGFQLTIKSVYDKNIAPLPDYENSIPDYPNWFEPFVMKHLHEADEKVLNSFLVKSLERDNFVAPVDSGIKHSSSVIDIFSSLRATYEFLDKLRCPVPALNDKYHNRFCETIDTVLTEYTAQIMEVFRQTIGTLAVSCVILCNIHQVREELQAIFKTMGGDREQLDISARQTLDGTQKKLKEARNSVILDLVKNMKPEIEKSIKEIKNELRNIKNTKNDEWRELLFRSLIEYFDEVFKLFQNNLYDSVRKPLLQQAWKKTLKLFEEIIILPDINNLAQEEVQELNSKQSQVVESILTGIKEYFTKNCGKCLKAKTLEKTSEMQYLRGVLQQYRLTTDTLIKSFVEKAGTQNLFAEQESQGEIQFQVDLFEPPGQEHYDCTVKGNNITTLSSSHSLRWLYEMYSSNNNNYFQWSRPAGCIGTTPRCSGLL